MPISDRANDKVDILLNIDEQPAVLVEVKRHRQMQNAEGQVRRYCALRRPRIAVLTDGVQWVFFLSGQQNVFRLLDLSVPDQTPRVAEAITALEPNKVQQLLQNGSLQYLNIIEQGFQQVGEETQKRLMPHFIATAASLVVPQREAAIDKVPARNDRAELLTALIALPAQIGAGQENSEADQIDGVDGQEGGSHDPFNPPRLTHTRVVSAKFAGEPATDWNSLLRTAVRAAVRAGRSVDNLRGTITAQLSEMDINERGYTVVTGTGISVQGVEARRAWSDVVKIAQELQVEVDVAFRWQSKAEAAYPGQSGSIRWSPVGHNQQVQRS